jgi:PKD repeat protein
MKVWLKLIIVAVVIAAIVGVCAGVIIYRWLPELEKEPRAPSPSAAKANQGPTADFEYTPLEPRVHEVIDFDGTPSRDIDGKIVNWTWDFGDGSPRISGDRERAAIVNHTYSIARIYTVTLIVRDDQGATDRINRTLRVRANDTEFNSTGIEHNGIIIDYQTNHTVWFDVEEYAQNCTITIDFMGLAYNGSAIAQVEVYNPYEQLLENRTVKILGATTELIVFDHTDLSVPGTYIIEMRCLAGTLRFSMIIEVRY